MCRASSAPENLTGDADTDQDQLETDDLPAGGTTKERVCNNASDCLQARALEVGGYLILTSANGLIAASR